MAFANTPQSYGSLARILHWLIALLIFAAIGLALYAQSQPRGTGAEVARVATLYSLHKTIGVAAFFAAVLRLLWAMAQPRPGALHPERRLETFVAAAVHWSLYAALLIMPVSGWLGHAALDGFAPILWPFGQSLPFVPKSDALARVFFSVHGAASKLLYASVGLHMLGALKHALIDRDGTLARMTRGSALLTPPQQPSALPALAALSVWAGIVAAGVAFAPPKPAVSSAPGTAATVGNWTVTAGTLGFSVKQMQAVVSGKFSGWTADIAYDDRAKTGTVTVTIPLSGMTVGSVTQQVAAPEFFDATAHPVAVFSGAIAETTGQLAATGTLTLRGKIVPVTLPFTLTLDGSTARMTGKAVLDRRDFGIGASYPDETTVGFGVTVDVALDAVRK